MQQENQTGMSSYITPEPTLYFGYGSNLSLTQMNQRCPGSTYTALALLKSWKWVISPRGYANVALCDDKNERERPDGEGKKVSVVYGLVYSLSLDGRDEARLDAAEGVPSIYEKKWMEVEVVGNASDLGKRGDNLGGKKLKVLVYVDPRGEELEGKPRNEYVYFSEEKFPNLAGL